MKNPVDDPYDDTEVKPTSIKWLRLQIRLGDESGEPIDGPTVMAELLAEAKLDIEKAK